MFLHKICFFVTPNKIFVSVVTVFENEGVPNNTSESAFQFILRNNCIKGRKIERLDACYMVEILIFKMF